MVINVQGLSQIGNVIQCARENKFQSCKEQWGNKMDSSTLDLLEKYVSLNKKSYSTEDLQFSNGKTTIDSVLYYLLEGEYILKSNKVKDDEAFYNFRKALSYDIPIELRSEIFKKIANYLLLSSTDVSLINQYVSAHKSICYDELECLWSDFLQLKRKFSLARIENKIPEQDFGPWLSLIQKIGQNKYQDLHLNVLCNFASYYAYFPETIDLSIETNIKGLELACNISDDTYAQHEFLLKANISNGYMRKGEHAKALNILQSFSSEVTAAQSLDNISIYNRWLSECYVHLNEPDSALHYSRLSSQNLRDADNLEFNGRIKEIEEKFQNSELKNELRSQKIFLWVSIFIFGLFSSVGFLLFNNYRLKKKVLEESLSKSEVESKLKTLNALTAERTRIAGEMHDDLGGGLTTIKFLSQKLQRKMPDEAHKTQLNKIVKHSQSLVSNMSEIIWAMNAGFDTLRNLIAYSRRFAFEYLEPYNIELSFNVEGDISDIELTGEKRRNLFLIIKEALHNTVKYSKSAKASISFRVEENYLHIYIADEGIGFSEQINKFGNGLKNMRQRVEQMNGEITIKGDNGVTIEIMQPLT